MLVLSMVLSVLLDHIQHCNLYKTWYNKVYSAPNLSRPHVCKATCDFQLELLNSLGSTWCLSQSCPLCHRVTSQKLPTSSTKCVIMSPISEVARRG
jgi:hypothetical protein